ncbi:hypothetical protein AND_001809 [Anopheles darlingi]|uniref:Uncharacterized protein n=1 Tax=Anopheles darlingi TaxID=43151 RepID=W5JT10_ANODA|nr:hypothetical protein AND_001809 [Anopheles darlingi]
MPVAREVLPSQETICEEDINLTKPFTEQLLDDSDEDIFLEINRTPETIQAATPPTRYGYSGVTSDTTGLHGSPIARSSPFIPNMMLRSPSIFARLTTDLQVPRLNLQRLRLSGKTLFSQKHLLDDMEDAGPSHAHRPASGRSIDDDDDDSVIGLRRPGKVRRIADTQSDAIEQHDAANEHRTVSPGNLKKIVREFICAEAEASDDCEMETEEEESNEEDDSFIVRDSQIEEAKPVSYERAMYLRSVRDLPRAGAFYFPDRQQRPPALSPWASPISDSIDSQQDTYDQSFLDEDAKADSHLSVLEQLEAKLEKTKAPKRTTPCSWN